MACVSFGFCRGSDGQILKGLLVPVPYFFTANPGSLDSFKLVNSDRCLQVHHVVLKASLNHPVVLVAFIAKTAPGIF